MPNWFILTVQSKLITCDWVCKYSRVYFSENKSFILTQDGALVIPSTANTIGVDEIDRAFRVLSDVQSNLIPEGWISNHYKWIVWKLASYQKFADNLPGCLNVENVIQQLKYRYVEYLIAIIFNYVF